MSVVRIRCLALSMLTLCLLVLGVANRGLAASGDNKAPARQIMVPGEDRFTPFAVTIRVGQKVTWVNNDSEDHYVVSDDAFNTAGHRGVNHVVPANGGKFSLTFNHPGVFPFYCRLHAMLDADNQPKAPGPEGGIQDSNGNFGTPMNGVVTVLGHQD
jgi:plastocyanin